MDKICKPAMVYFVVAIILCLVGVLMKLNDFNFWESFSNLLSIICCTIILAAICQFSNNDTISWIITGIYLICVGIFLVAVLYNWIMHY